MNYTVLWKPEAERQLATIWTQSTNRNLITESSIVILNEYKHQLA
jgi:hypothetical protein